MFTLLITLSFGLIIGFGLAIISILYLLKINCPQCKKPKLLKEIVVFRWKDRTITGQSCQRCQRPQPQIDISL